MTRSASHVLLLTSRFDTIKIAIEVLSNYKITLIVPKCLSSKVKPFLASHASVSIIDVESYENSGEVELKALKAHQQSPFHHIVSLEEMDVLRAAHLREYLGLRGQNVASAQAYTNKIIMKNILREKGISIPLYAPVSSLSDIQVFINQAGYPIVVKPATATENSGVRILKDDYDLEKLTQETPFFHFGTAWFLEVEKFMPGTLYHVNGVFHQGKVVYAWPSIYASQPIGLSKGLSAASYTLAKSNPLVKRLNSFACQILEALPSPESAAFHLEVFHTAEDELVFCEIASRIGGKGVNQSWIESLGINLIAETIRVQVGLLPHVSMPPMPRSIAGEIWFPMISNAHKAPKETCPFSWTVDYELPEPAINGDCSSDDRNHMLFGGASLLKASNENEMRERLDLFSRWFKDTYRDYLYPSLHKHDKNVSSVAHKLRD